MVRDTPLILAVIHCLETICYDIGNERRPLWLFVFAVLIILFGKYLQGCGAKLQQIVFDEGIAGRLIQKRILIRGILHESWSNPSLVRVVKLGEKKWILSLLEYCDRKIAIRLLCNCFFQALLSSSVLTQICEVF